MRARRYFSVLQVAPQRDGQSPGQGHDAHAPHASSRTGEASVEPVREIAVGLQSQPTPGLLDEQRSDSSIAGLADALLAIDAAAGMRRRRQAKAAGELAPVGE